MKEITVEEAKNWYNWEVVKSHPISTISDALKAAKNINPMQSEGFVVVDKNFNRIKVKSPQYVALHHAKREFTQRRMIEVARANEISEFLVYFPELREEYSKVLAKIDSICKEVEEIYDRVKDIQNQKEFALEAVKSRYSSILFGIRSGKWKNVREWFSKATFCSVERLICG